MARTYGTNAQRGYNATHWKLRANWKPLVEAGLVQCRAIDCQEERDGRTRWIAPGTPWHLGHTPDRSTWTGPEHARCNLVDGARRGNQNRDQFILAATPHGPTCKICGVKYHYTGKQCMICGRHYHPSRGVQYTCSRACGVAFRRITHGWAGNKPPSPPAPCEVCGKPCPPTGRKTCSDECARERRDSKRQELRCEQCGKKFEGVTARWCSPNCQSIAYYYANLDERRTIARERARKKAALARTTGNGVRMTGMMTAVQSREW